MGGGSAFNHKKGIPMTLHLVRIFLFTLPFQFALNPIPGIDLHISRIFALLIFFSWLAAGFARRKLVISLSVTSMFFVSFVFLAAVSFLWAEQESTAIRRAIFFLSFAPLFLVFSSMISERREKSTRFLLEPFFFGAVLAALVGIIQASSQILFGSGPVFHFWVGDVLPFFLGASFSAVVAEYPSLLANIGGITVLRASAFFPDPHIYAYYMGIAFPIGILFAASAETAFRKHLFVFLSVIILFADLLSFSRGAYLGLAVGAIVFLPIFFSRFDTRKKLYVTIFLLFSVATMFFHGNPVGSRLLSAFSFEEGSNQGRIAMWQIALKKISEQPMLGYGLGNYPFSVKPDAAPREPIYAHNLFLDIATETGIVGAILFSSALIAALLALSRSNPILMISLLIFIGHSLVETPLYSVHIFPPLLLLLAFGSVWNYEYGRNNKGSPS